MVYGKQTTSVHSSLSFTNIAVDEFTNAGPDGNSFPRIACTGKDSLGFALLYLDKLRRKNSEHLTTVPSADRFLKALMVASKFLHDDGKEEAILTNEWTAIGEDRPEISFLIALEWWIHEEKQGFARDREKTETDIASKEVSNQDLASDLDVLRMNTNIQNPWSIFMRNNMTVTAGYVTAYTAGPMYSLCTAAALHKSPVGPEAVSPSTGTLAASLSSKHVDQVTADKTSLVAESAQFPVTPADLLSAPLNSCRTHCR